LVSGDLGDRAQELKRACGAAARFGSAVELSDHREALAEAASLWLKVKLAGSKGTSSGLRGGRCTLSLIKEGLRSFSDCLR